MNIRQRYLYVWLLAAITITFCLYYSGLAGPYLFDDVHVVETNRYLRISSLNPTELVRAMESFGANNRQLSMLSFALNYYFLGDSAWSLKIVNVIIHCLNGWLLFLVSTALVRILRQGNDHNLDYLRLVPIIATSIWLVNPINLTSVLYISQRMTLLSSCTILVGLLSYIWARTSITQTPRKLLYYPLIITCFSIIGFYFKENGALLPLYIAIVEIFVFRFRSEQKFDKTVLFIFAAGFFLALAAIIYKFSGNPNWIFSGYANREFTLAERVLTQFRALVFYIYQIVLPSNGLLGLWHDDFPNSTSLFSPYTTLLSAMLLLVLFVGAVLNTFRTPLISLGILWFFVSHAMESTIIPLEMIHEHRNYLASFGITIAVTSFLLLFATNFKIVALSFIAGLFIWNSTVLASRSEIWSSRDSLYEQEASAHPKSTVASYTLGIHYFRKFNKGDWEYGERAKEKLLHVRALEPNQFSAEMALIVASENGAFAYDPEWLESAISKYPNVKKIPALQAAIVAFLGCLDSKICKNSKPDAYRLFDMFRESPNYTISSLYAFYYSGQGNDPEKADYAFRKSIRATDAKSWTNYLLFLIREEKMQQACDLYNDFTARMLRFEFKNSAKVLGIVQRIETVLKDC